MHFRILGPLEVRDGPTQVDFGGPRRERVLAALLLHANRIVVLPYLVDVVWDDSGPATATKQVRNCVSVIRGALAGLPVDLVTTSVGYRLRVDHDDLDLAVFQRCVESARRAQESGDGPAAAGHLEAGLALWRGSALSGLDCGALQPLVANLDEQRLAAIERLAALRLRTGDYDSVVEAMFRLTGEHPLREGPVAHLMVALHRAGRRAEALDCYHRLRGDLGRHLGLEPGQHLRHLYEQILCEDPALGRARRGGADLPDRVDPWVTPRQLPRRIRNFVGRGAELAYLGELTNRAGSSGGNVITAVTGMAGVGKTTLAVHFAHLIAPQFPDGQVFIDFRGFDAAAPPLGPAEAIRGVLEAVGVPSGQAPPGSPAQIGLYRSLLATRRVLLVLDNVQNSDQVRPLLPASPTCLIIITSRDQLTGLVAAEDAGHLNLGLLSEDDAAALITTRVGHGRTADDPRAVRELVRLCARLPLALSVAAARTIVDPGLPVSALVAALRDERGRLDTLNTGAPGTDLRAVFAWSTQALSAPAARAFAMLGLHYGPDISATAAASLLGSPLDQATTALAELCRTHLLQHADHGRFAFHDLLRLYATEQLDRASDAGERDAAIARVFDHYLHTAAAATSLLHPGRDRLQLPPPNRGVTPERLDDSKQALAWYDAEFEALKATITLCHDRGAFGHCWQLAWIMMTYLDRRASWQDMAAMQQTAQSAVRHLEDRSASARICGSLGYAHTRLGAYTDAYTQLRTGLELHRQLGDTAGQAQVYLSLARVDEHQHRYAEALRSARHALGLMKTASHGASRANALNAVGWYHAQLGNYASTLTYCRRALALHRQLGHRVGEAAALDSLGYAEVHLGRHRQAISYYQRALQIRIDLDDRTRLATTLDSLGGAYQAAGDFADARHCWMRAIQVLDALHHPDAGVLRTRVAQLSRAG